GVMAKAAAEALVGCGARVRVLNRTPERAARLLAHLGPVLEIGTLTDLSASLREAVLVVGATASRQPVVSFAAVAAALDARDGRPLVLLDVALPRDIDPRARELHRATLIDLDDLERLCPVDAHDRSAERRRAEALAAEEADRLADWLRFRAV